MDHTDLAALIDISKVQLQFSLSDSNFTAAAVQNNVLVLALSSRRLLRIDLERGEDVDDVDLPTSSSDTATSSLSVIKHLFLDPDGLHLLIYTEKASGPSETFYLHSQSRTPRLLHRLKNVKLTSVAWSPHRPTASTREILVGDKAGNVYEVVVDGGTTSTSGSGWHPSSLGHIGRSGSSSGEKLVKHVWKAGEGESIVGLWADTVPQQENRRRVMVATPNRLFHFTGSIGHLANDGGSKSVYSKLFEAEAPTVYETASSSQSDGHQNDSALTSLGSLIGFSALRISPDFISTEDSAGQVDELSDRWFAWLSSHQQILHGRLTTAPTATNGPVAPKPGFITTGSDVLGNLTFDRATLLNASTIASATTSTSQRHRNAPAGRNLVAFTISQWHMLLLVDGRIVAVRLLDDEVVFDQAVLGPNDTAVALTADRQKNTYWLFTTHEIFEIVMPDEDRDVWKVMLKRNQYSLASRFARTSADRDAVASASGDFLIGQQRFLEAADVYGKSSRSFEQIALIFIDHGEQDALRAYLLAKLTRCPKAALMQRTMLSSWLVELFMSRMNTLDDTLATKVQSTEKVDGVNKIDNESNLSVIRAEFRDFVARYKQDLDKQTVYELVSSHGREQELLTYATIIDDHEYILSYWVQREKWDETIYVLQRQTEPQIFYKYSTVLMASTASHFVDILMRHDDLDPVKLIPALLNYNTQASKESVPLAKNQAVRYLNWCINSGVTKNSPTAIHNTLIAIYASHPSPGESSLLNYLSAHSDTDQTPPYDADFAFRLCMQHRRIQAAVQIYSSMGDYSSAVALALKYDQVDLATLMAERTSETDPTLRKKLWLEVAKKVIQQAPSKSKDSHSGKGGTGDDSSSIKTALGLLKRCPLLRIEDLIPFFPDFVVIDTFKDEICAALETYSRSIAQLDAEMDASSRTAELVKRDIAALDRRYALVEPGESCRLCELPLLSRQFFLFPSCQHGFHSDCLGDCVLSKSGLTIQKRVKQLRSSLARGSAGKARERDLLALDDLIAAQCVLCGEIAIKGIEEPFLTPDDDLSIWEV